MRTTIHRGHMNIEFHEDGSLHVTHEEQGTTLMLSRTEWDYLCAVADLHGWPLVSVRSQRKAVEEANCL